MDVEELLKELQAQRAENQMLRNELQAQRAENQMLRNELAKALSSLEQATARIKQLEGQAAKDSHNKSPAPIERRFQGTETQNAESARKERKEEWRATRSCGQNLDDGGATRFCSQTDA